MVWVLDTETGRRVAVTDPAMAIAGFRAQRYQLPAGERVDVINAQGEPVSIDPSEFQRLVLDPRHGYRLPDLDESNRQARIDTTREAAGGQTAAQVGAFVGEAIPRALTLGMIGQQALTGQVGENLAEAEPGATEAGNITGSLASAALLPGASQLGEIGAGAGRLATRALGGGALARTIGSGTALAAEGAVIGTGIGAGEAIRDPEHAAEHLMTNIGTGALLGGGAGVLGRGALETGMAAGRGAVNLATRAAEAGRGVIERGMASGDGVISGTIGRLTGRAGRQSAEQISNRAAVRSLNGGVPGARQIVEDLGREGEQRLGARLNGLQITGHDVVDIATRARRIENELQVAGAEVGQALQRADAAFVHPQIPIAGIESDIQAAAQNIRGRFRTEAAENAAQRLERQYVPMFEDWTAAGKTHLTTAEAHELRRSIDANIVNFAREELPTSVQRGFKEVRRNIESRIESTLGNVESAVGEDVLAAYREAKAKYQDMRVARDLVERGVNSELGRNAYSPSVLGIAAAGLAGGSPTTVLAGLAGARLRQVAQDYGDAALAAAIRPGSIEQRMTRVFGNQSEQVGSAVRGILQTGRRVTEAAEQGLALVEKHGPAVRRAAAAAGRRARTAAMVQALSSDEPTYRAAVDRVREAAGNPRVIADRMATITQPIAAQMPREAAAMATQAMRAVAYLQSHIPASDRLATAGIQPQYNRASVSSVERQSFMRRMEAADNPRAVLTRISDGSATREEVETLRAVYPQLFAQLQREAVDQVASLNRRLTWREAQELSQIFGIAADGLLSGQNIAAMQSTYANPPAEQQALGTPSGRPVQMTTLSSSNEQRERDS